MRHARYLMLLSWLIFTAAVLSSTACGGKGSDYVGRWECSTEGAEFFEIVNNKDVFLVTDESNDTYPAELDDKGTLVVSGVPFMGSVPLPIDSNSGELICSACVCNRFSRKKN